MSCYKILGYALSIGGIMAFFQLLKVSGDLDVTEIYLLGDTDSNPLKVSPLYETIKLLLLAPEMLHEYIVSVKPTASKAFVGAQGLTGINEEGFISFLLIFSSFFYFFFLSLLLGKASTMFPVERDQKLFFFVMMIIYISFVAIVGNV